MPIKLYVLTTLAYGCERDYNDNDDDNDNDNDNDDTPVKRDGDDRREASPDRHCRKRKDDRRPCCLGHRARPSTRSRRRGRHRPLDPRDHRHLYRRPVCRLPRADDPRRHDLDPRRGVPSWVAF